MQIGDEPEESSSQLPSARPWQAILDLPVAGVALQLRGLISQHF